MKKFKFEEQDNESSTSESWAMMWKDHAFISTAATILMYSLEPL